MSFGAKTHLFTVVVVLLSVVAHMQSMLPESERNNEDNLNARELECCQPFLSAAKDLLACQAILYQGEIRIEISLPGIELAPNGILALAPGSEMGDFEVSFLLTPMLSKGDFEKVMGVEKERIKKVRKKGDGELPFRAHLKTKDHWYGIVGPLYFPANQVDADKVNKFIVRLSQICRTLDDESPEALLGKMILGKEE